MSRNRLAGAALAVVVVSVAQAQGQQDQAAPRATLAEQCLALLDGRVPANVDPVRLRPQCAALLQAGAGAASAGAAQSGVAQSGVAQSGVAQSGVGQGESVRTGFTQPGNELTGQPLRSSGLVSNTLTTNPIGWFSGLGVNAEYRRPLEPAARFSYVMRGWYSRVSASNGDVSTFGTGGGADMYLLGGRNEGLRLGPRFVLAFGRESIQGSSNFARLGAAGELGYDFIASSGLSGSVAGGFGGRLLGDASNDNFASFTAGETGPYVTVGAGYSW